MAVTTLTVVRPSPSDVKADAVGARRRRTDAAAALVRRRHGAATARSPTAWRGARPALGAHGRGRGGAPRPPSASVAVAAPLVVAVGLGRGAGRTAAVRAGGAAPGRRRRVRALAGRPEGRPASLPGNDAARPWSARSPRARCSAPTRSPATAADASAKTAVDGGRRCSPSTAARQGGARPPSSARRRARRRGRLARDLVNTAPDDLRPAEFADAVEARPPAARARGRGARREGAGAKGGYGGILGVGQGSVHPPRLVRSPTSRRPRPNAAPGARRQGHHVRLRRPVAQAGRRHGDDEVRHGRRRRGRRGDRSRSPSSSLPVDVTGYAAWPRTCRAAHATSAPATC